MAAPTFKSKTGKKGKPARAVYLQIGIWHNLKTGRIHIASRDKRFKHTTVSNTRGSKRYHPNLYGKLKAVLLAEGRWP